MPTVMRSGGRSSVRGRRRTVLAAWTAAVVGVVAVSGACTRSPDPDEAVGRAPDRTVEAGSAQISARVRITPAGPDPMPVTVTGTGAADFATGRARLTAVSGGEAAEVVFDGPAVIHLPQVAGAAGRAWLAVHPRDLALALTVDGLSDLATAHAYDPLSAVQSLRGAGTVRRVGTERLRGTRTTWYDTTVDLEDAAEGAPSAQRATLRALAELLGSGRIDTDVWLDEEGRVRRIRQALDYGSVTSGGQGSVTPGRAELTLELWDYGSEALVRTPPDTDVADLGDALGRIARGEGSGNASPATDALVPRLLSELPTGYQQEPDSVNDTGPSDLDKAVRDDVLPDARKALEGERFLAGYQRMWSRDTQSAIVDFVYQFATAAGAAHYLERTRTAFYDDADPKPFEVPGVPGAKGFRITDEQGTTAVVFLARDGLVGQIVIVGPDAESDLAVQLARQQYDRFG